MGGGRPQLAPALAIAAPLVLFAAIAVQVVHGTPGWDGSLARLVEPIGDLPAPSGAGRWLDHSPLVGAIAVLAVLLALAARGRVREVTFIVVAVGGVVALEPVLKHLFDRPPPADASGLSFPSGSAMASMAAVASIVLLTWRTPARWVALAAGGAFVLLYGAAVVVVGWHYPSDVIAGWCIALAWVAALWLAKRVISSR
jgi:membrane-associated phospholipid phosphatase